MNFKRRLPVMATLLMLCFCTVMAQTQLFYESFDACNNTGGNDGKWGGSGIANGKIKSTDFPDWVFVKGSKANKCIKIGTGTVKGSATTPSFQGTGNATLTFRTGAWKGHSLSLQVKVMSGEATILDETVTLKDSEFTDYELALKGLKGRATVTFAAEKDSGNVFFLDEVKVISATIDPNAPAVAPTLTKAFTFWPEANYAPSATIYITPADGMETFYTTNGEDPSRENGTPIDEETDVKISKTTTVKAIAYNGEKQSDIVTQTYTLGATLTDIRSFNHLTVGDSARLYFSDDADARVVFVNGTDVYLRDRTGAVCLSDIKASRAMKHNQHIAGWIIGKKGDRGGLPLFEAISKTDTRWLIIADPVTEEPTQPTEVTPATYDDHRADWICLKNLRIRHGENGQSITGSNGNNLFGIDNSLNGEGTTAASDLYEKALVDVHGMAIPHAGQQSVSLTAQAGYLPWIYVLNQHEEYMAPPASIRNAMVRLHHPLSAGYWNSLCLPFDAEIANAQIREFTSVDGSIMKFDKAERIRAGVPCLVKPTEDLPELVFSNVELTAKQPQSVMRDGYGFVGIYSPTRLKTDKSHQFLGEGDRLYYPTSEAENLMPGTRAYFIIPAQVSNAKVMIDGSETTGIDSLRADTNSSSVKVYNLNGQMVGDGLKNLPKGIYIINGKKHIIK